MILNLNYVAAVIGCIALLVCWLVCHKSGKRGLLLALGGCLVIIAATLAYKDTWRLADFAGIVLACCVLLLLFLSISMVTKARRRRVPHYQAPDKILGTCSECGRQGGLQRSKRGWLCRKCARRAVA